jgi:hypothetical protein
MNPLELEVEYRYRRQALVEEARAVRFLEQAGGYRYQWSARALLLIAGAIIALGMRLKDYGATGAQGYLPNLHIE